jgi:glutamate carboxypeptidase
LNTNTLFAHQWLESQQSTMVADLTELCNQNSGSRNLDGLIGVSTWIADWANLSPATLQRIELPTRRGIRDAGEPETIATGPVLRWDFQPKASRRVLLMIHYDTVFGSDHEFQSCEMLSPQLLRGPGVADAKGGIVVLRYALQAMLKFGLAADLGWTVLLNPDEEVGSLSSAALMRELAPKYDFGLLFEPALPSGELVSERKGSGNFTITVRGRAAHAGRNFEQGRNAIVELSRIVVDIHALNGQRPDTTINVGFTLGGGAVNVVPEFAIARINARIPDSDSGSWLIERLQQLVEATDARDGFSCQLLGHFTSPPKRINAAQQALMRAVEESSSKLNLPPPQWRCTGGVCDGNKLADAGLPNIDTLGPRGDGLHSSQESVQLDSLVEKSKLLVEILCGFSSGELDGLVREKTA